MEKEISSLAVQLIKLDNVIGDLSSNVTYSSKEVDFCISSFMENREKSKMKNEPLASLIPIKKENENNLAFIYEGNMNKCYKTEGSFIQKTIKEEFYDEVSDIYKPDPLTLSDGENKATNTTEDVIKINYVKGESVYGNIIKVENESIDVEYKYIKFEDDKQNIDIKENIIESLVVNSDAASTSVNEDCNKHDSRNYFLREAASVSDKRSFLTYQENVNTLHERTYIKIGHNRIESYKGNEYGKQFTAGGPLRQHYVIHKGYKYRREDCMKCFTEKKHLQGHSYNVHHRIKENECKKCKKKFTTLGNLKTHISSIHEGIKYKCKECKKSFTQLSNLREHIKTVHCGIKKYECKKCKKKFTTLGNLKTHISSIHEGIKYTCEKCKKSFTQLGYLQKHIKTVHCGIKEYKCKKCKKAFASSGYLKLHNSNIHEGIKYKCKECKKSLTQLSNLREHIKTVHCGIKKYECKKCKKAYTTSGNLKLHISNIHEGIKYKCEECKKSFTHLIYLREHIKILHCVIKKYECKRCKKMFTTLGNLKTHISSIHEGIKFMCVKNVRKVLLS